MEETRAFWLNTLQKVSTAVLEHLAAGTLSRQLPASDKPGFVGYGPLEAFGRTVYGIAPWLELDSLTGVEAEQQRNFRTLFYLALAQAVDPSGPDIMKFGGEGGRQPLVDAAFLCAGLLRAPRLTAEIPANVRENLVHCLQLSRRIQPLDNNWVLFSASVEAGLDALGAPCDKERAMQYLRRMLDWYKGDGLYGDGASFRFDYYNSFVIHPMLLELARFFALEDEIQQTILRRAQRYGQILERMIAPDGSYPVVGRSVCYRFGAFHLLSVLAWNHQLPESLSPAQVRCGLTAVMRRILSAPNVFDAEGWLTVGVYGQQPSLGERYIDVGSLYHCCGVFPALGLNPDDPFWAMPDAPWTGRLLWEGADLPADKALRD